MSFRLQWIYCNFQMYYYTNPSFRIFMNRYIQVTGLFSLICMISLSIVGVRGNLINSKAIVKLCTKPYCKRTPPKIQDLWFNTFMGG